jgi:KaiC/GvpD/RAD55 family RecA-like ATPase
MGIGNFFKKKSKSKVKSKSKTQKKAKTTKKAPIKKIQIKKAPIKKVPIKKTSEIKSSTQVQDKAKIPPVQEKHLKQAHKEIHKQSKQIKARLTGMEHIKKEIEESKKEYIWTGIKGMDALFDDGIISGNAIIIAGGTGTGKTILTLQIMHEALKKGEKCLYMTLEESEGKLISHMRDFGWDGQDYLKSKQLVVKRINPFDLVRSVDALLARAKGELLLDINPIILPEGFMPDKIFIDSLTAMAAAFTEKDETYRIYIEQFFRYLESTKATSFLITETDQLPIRFSPTGVEEFLADGVIVLYNIRKGATRQRAIEVLKMRGVSHKHKVVAVDITSKGMNIIPTKEISIT